MTAHERTRHRGLGVSLHVKAVKPDRRRPPRGASGKQCGGVDFFEIITELPLLPLFKLLPNFLKKLKISKNESCSTFQVLQLWFKKHFQILPPF